MDATKRLSTGYPDNVGNLPKVKPNLGALWAAFVAVSVLLLGTVSVAAPRQVGVVKSGGDQPRVELRREGSLIEVAVCAPTCNWMRASRVTLEAPFAEVPAVFTVLELGAKHRAGLLRLVAVERVYEVLVAAPSTTPASPTSTTSALAPSPMTDGPAAATEPPASAPPGGRTAIVFAGETGLVQGEAPDRTGRVVEVLPSDQGTVSVVIGSVQEDVNLCGRPALLNPQLLHPETLTLRGIKFQRVPRAERDSATTLSLVPRGTLLSNRVLNPLVASSGQKAPSVLADDDPSTVWTEGRGGTGAGEFVVLRAPSSIGLTGLTFTLPESPDAGYSAPETFWIVTDQTVFRAAVTQPTADVREWHVPFPSPVHTSCVALALDGAKDLGPDTLVGWAEIGATTDVDEARLAQALADLDTGGDQATVAEQLLQAVGREAFERVRKRYEHYSESGRMRALNVLDAAPCKVAVPTYASALEREGSAEAEHGRNGLLRCKTEALQVLSQRLVKAGSERARLLSATLVQLDAVAALDAMVPLLDGGSRARRQVLKLAVAHAVRDQASLARATGWLSDADLSPRRGLFLLRALGDQLGQVRDVAMARLQTWRRDTSFETQYLALEPMAKLAPHDPIFERALQKTACCSKEPALRTEAARLLPTTPGSTETLIAALSDAHVRVREAAVVSAGEQRVTAARSGLVRRLNDDPWPFVRSAAVRAIGELPAESASTRAVGRAAIDDPSANVRRPALFVLGALNARAELENVRDAFNDDKDADVRAAAAATLGLLCDPTMLDPLTEAALKLATLTGSEGERIVAQASLHALGRLAPADLKQRLAPFFAKGVLQTAKMSAQAALDHPEPCPAPSRAQ